LLKINYLPFDYGPNCESWVRAEEQNARCGLIVDRVRMPSDARARI